MRAMTFERLVRDEAFVSRLLTTTVGSLALARPAAVRRSDAGVSVDGTATALAQAHLKAVHERTATMITSLAVPFVGMEGEPAATPVKPDFAIVTPRFAVDLGGSEADVDAESARPVGSWLVMGDAKDYERVRSRIDDRRYLKGFLQVALGAEAVETWSKRKKDMRVHRSGALAVPRNAFLQPTSVVDRLDDHREEVRAFIAERARDVAESGGSVLAGSDDDAPARYVSHLAATFDPGTCPTCSLFTYCRAEVRADPRPVARLIEIGVRPELRAALEPVADGSVDEVDGVPESVLAGVLATRDGRRGWSGQRRVDPAGEPGTIDVLLAKSDSAALGAYGVALRVHGSEGPGRWSTTVFDDPQAHVTRLALMSRVGEAVEVAMAVMQAETGEPGPISIITPDTATGDLLASVADSLAGLEISRLRWERDIEVGRPPLTFDGDPATVPTALTAHQRLAVSFLLDQDRGRAFELRESLVDLRDVLGRHLVPGGPFSDAGRLDYLVRWGEATTVVDHRAISDEISDERHTPGARLSNAGSDLIHQARGEARYRDLVRDELGYKCDTIDRALAVLRGIERSTLREAYTAIEGRAQEIWRRRIQLHAYDLVRFGRVNARWRNDLVPALDADATCATALTLLTNRIAAWEMASDAGTKGVTWAQVVSTSPLRLALGSRRLGEGDWLVLVHRQDEAAVERPGVSVKVQASSFKLSQMSVACLVADEQTKVDGSFLWEPKVLPDLEQDEWVVLADVASLSYKPLTGGHHVKVDRPGADTERAPGPECGEAAFSHDPDNHQWCCRPHEVAEAETSDWFAERRSEGRMNPEVWPPLVDTDAFDTVPKNSTTEEGVVTSTAVAPELTADDLD